MSTLPNLVWYSLAVEGIAKPGDALPALPEIPRGALVVLTGRAPIWRYGMAWHRLHGSAAGAVATYDPKLGAVVIFSHVDAYREGDVLDIAPPSA